MQQALAPRTAGTTSPTSPSTSMMPHVSNQIHPILSYPILARPCPALPWSLLRLNPPFPSLSRSFASPQIPHRYNWSPAGTLTDHSGVGL